MNPTNHSSCLSYNSTLTLMRLFPLPSGSISMHQRAEPANTLCTLFYGRSLSSGFFLSLPIPCSLFFSTIHGISGNSAALTRFRMLLKLPDLSRTSLKIFRLFLSAWLTLLSQSARPLIPARLI